MHSCLPLLAGHYYELRFQASATPGAKVRVRVQNSQDQPDTGSLDKEVALTGSPGAYAFTFGAVVSSDTHELTFQLGGNPTFALLVGNASLVEKR